MCVALTVPAVAGDDHDMAEGVAASPAMQFLVESLKKHPAATYADLKAKADREQLKVFPIMYGRAKALLGLVGGDERGTGKAARANEAPVESHAARRGRPRDDSSKSGQVRELLKTGMHPAEIAAKVGCTVGLVYNVRLRSERRTRPAPSHAPKAAAAPSRPSKATAAPSLDGLASVLEAIQDSQREGARMRAVLERLRTMLQGVLG